MQVESPKEGAKLCMAAHEKWDNYTLERKVLVLRNLASRKDGYRLMNVLYPRLQLQNEEWEVIMSTIAIIDIKLIEEYYSYLLILLNEIYTTPTQSLASMVNSRLQFLESHFSIDIDFQLHRFIRSFRSYYKNITIKKIEENEEKVLAMLVRKKDEVTRGGKRQNVHPAYILEHIAHKVDKEVPSGRRAQFFYYHNDRIITRVEYQKQVREKLHSLVLPELAHVVLSYVP